MIRDGGLGWFSGAQRKGEAETGDRHRRGWRLQNLVVVVRPKKFGGPATEEQRQQARRRAAAMVDGEGFGGAALGEAWWHDSHERLRE